LEGAVETYRQQTMTTLNLSNFTVSDFLGAFSSDRLFPLSRVSATIDSSADLCIFDTVAISSQPTTTLSFGHHLPYRDTPP
jgi:hypothetical protein